jgi:hypothetical protein
MMFPANIWIKISVRDRTADQGASNCRDHGEDAPKPDFRNGFLALDPIKRAWRRSFRVLGEAVRIIL